MLYFNKQPCFVAGVDRLGLALSEITDRGHSRGDGAEPRGFRC